MDTSTELPELIPIGEAARLLGVSVETVRRWERQGKVSATRTAGDQRRFSREDILARRTA